MVNYTKGGIGNQLFQHVFAQSLARRLGASLQTDASYFAADPYGFAAAVWHLDPQAQSTRVADHAGPGSYVLREGQIQALAQLQQLPPDARSLVLEGYWQGEAYFERDVALQTYAQMAQKVATQLDAGLVERLKASPRAYDVVFPTATPYARDLVADGKLAELDKRLLPNLSHLDPAILAELAESDPGNAHLIPYMWGTTGLGVNVERVRAVLGPSAPLDSWGLLFNPANAAKLSKCGIGVLESSLDAVPPALFWKGMDPRDFSDGANATVRGVYDAIRPHIRKFENGNDLITGLANGSYCLVLTYSGDVRQARDARQQVRLVRVARHDHGRVPAQARQQHLQLHVGAVLSLVDHHEGVVQGAAAHKADRRDLDGALGHQGPHALDRQAVGESVVERAQIGGQLVFHVARQIADRLAGLDSGAREHDAADTARFQRLDRLGDGDVGLAGAGRA